MMDLWFTTLGNTIQTNSSLYSASPEQADEGLKIDDWLIPLYWDDWCTSRGVSPWWSLIIQSSPSRFWKSSQHCVYVCWKSGGTWELWVSVCHDSIRCCHPRTISGLQACFGLAGLEATQEVLKALTFSHLDHGGLMVHSQTPWLNSLRWVNSAFISPEDSNPSNSSLFEAAGFDIHISLKSCKSFRKWWVFMCCLVQSLEETLPLLLKKMDRLQNNSSHMPNISENIHHIRQLIQQARNAASKVDTHTHKHTSSWTYTCSISYFLWLFLCGLAPSPPQVSIPMKFNGKSGVQIRTPPNLADLASYTSLKLYITLPEAARQRRQEDGRKQFVFYLGNKDVSIATSSQCVQKTVAIKNSCVRCLICLSVMR